MNDLPVSIFCPYCKRYTALTPAHIEVGFKGSYNSHTKTVRAVWKRSHDDVWWIGICNNCTNPVLVHNLGDIVYPTSLPSPTDQRIPEHIKRDIDEAKLCFSVNAYRACAVMARRAIQNACIDKGANRSKKLYEQIEELKNEGIITNDIKEWADLVRWVGNDAAHPDSQEVTKEDAEDVLKLAEQFMNVIYVTPAIARERKNQRKT
jgi:HEPN domain-containing protein